MFGGQNLHLQCFEDNVRQTLWSVAQIMRRYHVQGRDDYKKYSKLCGVVTRLVHFLKKLESSDPVRIELTDQLLEKYGTVSCCAYAAPHLQELIVASSAAGCMPSESSPQRRA